MRYTRGFVAIYVAAAAASAPRWVLRPAADNISVGSTGANQTSSGVCWDEWNQYWSASLRATETSYEVDYSTLTTTLGTGVHTFEIGSTRTILPSGFYSYEEVTYTVITTRIEYEATPKTGYETRLTTQTETLREGPSIIGTQTYTYTMPDLGLSFFPSTRTFTEVFTSATATDPLITPPRPAPCPPLYRNASHLGTATGQLCRQVRIVWLSVISTALPLQSVHRRHWLPELAVASSLRTSMSNRGEAIISSMETSATRPLFCQMVRSRYSGQHTRLLDPAVPLGVHNVN